MMPWGGILSANVSRETLADLKAVFLFENWNRCAIVCRIIWEEQTGSITLRKPHQQANWDWRLSEVDSGAAHRKYWSTDKEGQGPRIIPGMIGKRV
jgi:hypothetical protein